MIEFVGGFVMGIVFFVGYGAHRALKSKGWDDSNILNWLRLLSMVYIHPEWFGDMYYLNDDMVEALFDSNYDIENYKPFHYINKDEFKHNFPNSRPK